MPISERPDPDQLLDRLQQEEARARRGRLKIFFGASAGVGKTFAMLVAARALRDQGVDVLAGIVETHGRGETAALLQGLEQLPRREIAYRDRMLEEFDLDAALAACRAHLAAPDTVFTAPTLVQTWGRLPAMA